MESSRRLAAIMFSDIVGYTGLMARNEQEALALLDQNREVQQPLIELFGGRFIKEMGDGVLASFDNSSDAVLCACAIQKTAKERGVNLRIGMHQGEVVFRDDDVFGDGVNIAARIEPLAETGQLLVSETIYRDVFNKAGITAELIGERQLKNVPEAMKVYLVLIDSEALNMAMAERHGAESKSALESSFGTSTNASNGAGARTSKSVKYQTIIRWMVIGFVGIGGGVAIWMNMSGSDTTMSEALKEKRVAVLIFDNPTNNENLEGFGTWAADHITSQLARTEDIQIVTLANITSHLDLTSDGNTSNPQFAHATGADVVIQGRCYINGDRMVIHASAVDGATSDLIHPFEVEGDPEDLQGMLYTLTQEILGYWAVQDMARFDKRPPKFDAYQNFLKGSELFLKDPAAEDYLLKAIELDSTLYTAMFKLYWLYAQTSRPEQSIDMKDKVAAYQIDFTPWEQARYDAINAKNRFEFAAADMRRYLIDPNHYGDVYQAAYSQLIAMNNPRKALEIVSSFDKTKHDEWIPEIWVSALYSLGQYEGMLVKIDSIDHLPTLFDEVFVGHLSALVQLGRTNELEVSLKYYERNFPDLGIPDKRYLLYWICNEADVADQFELKSKYAARLLEDSKDTDPLSSFFRGASHYWLDDFEQSLNTFQKIDIDHLPHHGNAPGGWSKPWALKSWIVLSAVKSGKNDVAHAVLAEFPSSNENYVQAVMYAAMNDKVKATSSLQKYIDNINWPFVPRRLKRDCMLKSLFDYAPFEVLVRPIE